MKNFKVGDIVKYNENVTLYFLNMFNFSNIGEIIQINKDNSIIKFYDKINKSEEKCYWVKVKEENFDKIMKL